jgi:TRAP-type C4-dicarboxylate transport system substrate-binding protein
MNIYRRNLILGSLSAAPLTMLSRLALAADAGSPLKISHQFPGGSIEEGDFRDRLARRFAAEVEKRTRGGLKFAVYPGSSLMKVNAQFSALRKGALDMSVIPLAYGGGELPELNIVAMPGIVTSYEQGQKWKNAEIGKALTDLLAQKGIVIVSWVWQSGGAASRANPVINPEDVKGLKVRGGSREMDIVVKAAGGSALSVPSSESYAAMQTGAVEVVTTTSTSLMSFRIDEVSKHLTFNTNGRSYWFQLLPLLMSKTVFDNLSREQQATVMAVGADMEKFGNEASNADNQKIVQMFARSGVKVHELSDTTIEKWVAVAKESAWKDYAGKSAGCASFLKLAEKVK